MRVSTTTFTLGMIGIATLCSACAATVAAQKEGGIVRQQVRSTNEPPRTGAPSDVLTADEMLKANVMTTAEGVRRLRPEFLRATQVVWGTGPAQAFPVVYLNGMYVGRPEALDLIALDAVEEIRFVRATQAREWWGAYCACAGGVIYVRTKAVK